MLVRAASLVFTVVALGCTAAPTGQPSSSPLVSLLPSATPGSPGPSPAASTDTVAASAAAVETISPDEVPPVARLAAEGGDPVTGQLGTYVWGGQGSDSPWLPGAAIAVGRGEPLTVTPTPAADIAGWTARIVPADSSGPDGATSLGEGSGRPRFAAPKRGAWTLEVHLVFADDAGDASYFWRLDVR
jgi:hypothetical protein